MGRTSIENNDAFGNLLPSSMEVYTPNAFRIQKGEGDLNVRLPDINPKRGGLFQPFEYRPHAKYFGSDNQEAALSKRSGSQNRGGIPKPKKAGKDGHKTARVGSPHGFPQLKGTPRYRYENRRGSNVSIAFIKKDLNITNDDDLEKAYKNFLPNEIEMLKDDIEFRNVSQTSSIKRNKRMAFPLLKLTFVALGRNRSTKKQNNYHRVLEGKLLIFSYNFA